jgi:ACS family sodium-dependent inorganic phosphate cotransporter-like MFS transporter 5
MYAKWFPTQERTIAIAATQFGGNIGAVFMSPMAGYLAKHGYAGGWPSIFYTSSLIHIIWLIPWLLFAYDSPADDKGISPDEHLYILQNTVSQTAKVICFIH